MMKRIYHIAILALAFTACSKTETGTGNSADRGAQPIRFALSDLSLTRSGISEISDIAGNIRIRGTRGNSVIGKTADATGYENIGLILDSNTGLWKPNYTPEASWQYEDIEERQELDKDGKPTGKTITVPVINNKYSFSAYAFNANVPEGATVPTPVLVTSGDEFGMKITGLSQPETYVHPSDGKPFGYDYVLSNRFDVSTSKNGDKISGDVVKFHMEHALASVNVKMIVSKYVHYVKFLGIRLEGFYRTADMTCSSQALYGTSGENVWVSENLKDFNDIVGYQRGDVKSNNAEALIDIYPNASGEDYSEVLLNFCAIPQLLTKDCKLTLNFIVQQVADGPMTRMNQTWQLMRYEDWKYGQRNNYTIRISSAAELVATFEEWPLAYEVSGTILP